MAVAVHHADMLEWLTAYDGPLFDAVVTDPPYHLTSIVKRFGKPGSAPVNNANTKVGKMGDPYARAARGFMGKQWDGGDVAFRAETWAKVLAAMKPGAHLVAFSGTRTYHRMVCAIEDAGFEIRDQLAWAYGSGFPKSHNQPGGWGTALKPAWEPIALARKPLAGTVAGNIAAHGTGALNIDGCRVEADGVDLGRNNNARTDGTSYVVQREAKRIDNSNGLGRWPANLCHDGSEEVLGTFPDAPGQQYAVKGTEPSSPFANVYGDMPNRAGSAEPRNDSGSAARFFYSAKAGPLDRIGSSHATVKPVDLMRWLCRLITPPGGLILDPFAGSGTTGIAAMAEGFDCTMIDIEAEHVADIERKLAYLRGDGAMSFVEHDRKRDEREHDAGPLFGSAAA